MAEEAPQDRAGAQEQTIDEGGLPAQAGGMNLMSPEGFMLMLIAGTIDSIGIFLIFLGLDDFWITDFAAYSTIGLWILMRGGGFKKPTATGVEAAEKAAKIAKRLKWFRLAAFIGELIPYIGALPLWTLLVYSELQT